MTGKIGPGEAGNLMLEYARPTAMTTVPGR